MWQTRISPAPPWHTPPSHACIRCRLCVGLTACLDGRLLFGCPASAYLTPVPRSAALTPPPWSRGACQPPFIISRLLSAPQLETFTSPTPLSPGRSGCLHSSWLRGLVSPPLRLRPLPLAPCPLRVRFPPARPFRAALGCWTCALSVGSLHSSASHCSAAGFVLVSRLWPAWLRSPAFLLSLPRLASTLSRRAPPTLERGGRPEASLAAAPPL